MQNFKFLRVNVRELRLVLDINVDSAFPVSRGKFQLAANRDGAGDLSVSCVHRGDVAAAAVHGKDALRRRVVNDGVRIGSGGDGAKRLERLEVKHGDVVGATIAYESAAEFGRDRNPVNSLGIGDVAHDGLGI